MTHADKAGILTGFPRITIKALSGGTTRMPITEPQFNKFREKIDPILAKHPSVLMDRERFFKLSENQSFIAENNLLYSKLTVCYGFAEATQNCIEPTDLDEVITVADYFISKWETCPILSFFFENPLSGKDDETVIKMLEHLYGEWGKYDTIRVFPWTTKREVEKQYYDIFKNKPRWGLRSIAHKDIEYFY